MRKLITLLCLLLGAYSVQATTLVWQGTNVWTSTANWTPAQLPVAGDVCYIYTNGICKWVNTSATITGQVIVVGGELWTGTLNADYSAAGGIVWSNGTLRVPIVQQTARLTGTNTYANGTTNLIDLNGSQLFNQTPIGAFTGNGTINKIGSQGMHLTASCSAYTGTFNIYSGTVYAVGGTMFAGTLVIHTNATLDSLPSGITATFTNTIMNGGIIQQTGNNFFGMMGPIQLNTNTTMYVPNGGALTELRLYGVVSGSGSITKTGANTLSMYSTNTFTGDVMVNAGSLALNISNAVPSNVIINAGTTFKPNADNCMAGTLIVNSGTVDFGSVLSSTQTNTTIITTNCTFWGSGKTMILNGTTIVSNKPTLYTGNGGDQNGPTTFGGRFIDNGQGVTLVQHATSGSSFTFNYDNSTNFTGTMSISNDVGSGAFYLVAGTDDAFGRGTVSFDTLYGASGLSTTKGLGNNFRFNTNACLGNSAQTFSLNGDIIMGGNFGSPSTLSGSGVNNTFRGSLTNVGATAYTFTIANPNGSYTFNMSGTNKVHSANLNIGTNITVVVTTNATFNGSVTMTPVSTLTLQKTNIAFNSSLNLVSGGTMNLSYTGTNQARVLTVNGVQYPPSTYGTNNLSPYLSGSGFLQVTNGYWLMTNNFAITSGSQVWPLFNTAVTGTNYTWEVSPALGVNMQDYTVTQPSSNSNLVFNLTGGGLTGTLTATNFDFSGTTNTVNLTITNVGVIGIGNVYTYLAGADGKLTPAGSFTIGSQAGNCTISNIDTYLSYADDAHIANDVAGNVSITGNGSGALTIGRLFAYNLVFAQPTANGGAVSLMGYNSVNLTASSTVNGANSGAHTGSILTFSDWGGTGGAVTIGTPASPIGSGGVTIAGGIDSSTFSYFTSNGSISVYTTGPVSLGTLRSDSGENIGGSIVVSNTGSATVGVIKTMGEINTSVSGGPVSFTGDGTGALNALSISTFGQDGGGSYGGGGAPITISRYTGVRISSNDTYSSGSVGSTTNGLLAFTGNNGGNAGSITITNIGTGGVTLDYGLNTANYGGMSAGSASISTVGAITIGGMIVMSAPSGTRGTLVLTSTGGGITLSSLDMSKVSQVKLDCGTSGYIGTLGNLNTVASSGSGTLVSPYITTQQLLRVTSGKIVYYDRASSPALSNAVYRVADLSGTAGAGGLLVPQFYKIRTTAGSKIRLSPANSIRITP